MGRLAGRDYQDRVAEKVEAAQAVPVREVASLVTGEDWCRFLRFQARLHSYSANNVMLIVAQHAAAFAEGRVSDPFPTWVAGFRTWKALGRSVEQGQHGYAVLAPVHRVRRTAIDAAGNERPLDRGDLPNLEETEQRQSVLRGSGSSTCSMCRRPAAPSSRSPRRHGYWRVRVQPVCGRRSWSWSRAKGSLSASHRTPRRLKGRTV